MNKAFEFYVLYMEKDYKGLTRLFCESLLGIAKGDALFEEVWAVVLKHVK